MTSVRIPLASSAIRSHWALQALRGAFVLAVFCGLIQFSDIAYSSGWSAKAPMSNARNGHASVTVSSDIYVIGGYGPSLLSTVEVYNVDTDIWSFGTPMPSPRGYPAAAEVGGTIYVFGGYNGSFISDVIALDPMSGMWETMAPMPTPRASMATAVVGGKIYVIGGGNLTVQLQVVEVYDPVADSWATTTPLPERRNNAAASVIDGKIYVVGGCNTSCGYDGTGAIASTVVYDPLTLVWTPVAPMPSPRWALSSAVLDGKLLAAGGLGNLGLHSSQVDEYDPDLDSWTPRQSLTYARQALTLNEAGGALYAIGGHNGSQYVGYNERLVPDGDGDGVPDGADNCPSVANFMQTDSDADGVGNACDNCPTTPNPSQANGDGDPYGEDCDNCPSFATPWAVPVSDSDCDGFPDAANSGARGREIFIGTDPADRCADTATSNDETSPGVSPWPPDFNDNGAANLSDVVLFGIAFNTMPPNPAYSPRFDMNADYKVNLSDVVAIGPFFNTSCTP